LFRAKQEEEHWRNSKNTRLHPIFTVLETKGEAKRTMEKQQQATGASVVFS
jgi:hypothetical protein